MTEFGGAGRRHPIDFLVMYEFDEVETALCV